MPGKNWQEGFDHELGSHEDVTEAAERSLRMRAPLRDHAVDGEVSQGKIRPFWVARAVRRLAEVDEEIRSASTTVETTRKAAATARGAAFVLVGLVAVVAFDGVLLSGGIANAIPTFDSWIGRLAAGVATSTMCALGAWALGAAIIGLDLGRFANLVAAVVGGVSGWLAGAIVGRASGDPTEAVHLRALLSAASLSATCVLELIAAGRRNLVGPKTEAEKAHAGLVAERDKIEKAIAAYQDSALDAVQAHLAAEADRQDALRVARYAHDEQGIRTRWVSRRIAAAFAKFLASIGLAAVLTTALPSSIAQADTRVLVLDVTGSVNQIGLAERLLAATPLSFGDNVTAFTLSCRGLTPIYQSTIRKVSQAGHRQDLARVKQELSDALSRAGTSGENAGCSPITDSLLNLAIDLKLQVEAGETVTLVIASDFETNSDAFQINGGPFAGVDVIAVLPLASGRDAESREKAITLARRLFAHAKSLSFK